MAVIKGGQAVYGAEIGIVMLDCRFPRPLGDPGNARSFIYPVQYEIVNRIKSGDLTHRETEDAVQKLLQAAEGLEEKGCKSIATSCGLLLPHQKQMAERLEGPVASSALLLLPLLLNLIGARKKVAVIVSSKTDAVVDYLSKLPDGQKERCILFSMEHSPEFMRGIMSGIPPFQFDGERIERELTELCEASKEKHPDIGIFLLECTNLAPYSRTIRKKLELPVFDILGLIDLLHSGVET